MKTIIGFLKRNGFERMEVNSYANDRCNVVFQEGGGYAVANSEGDVIYSLDNNIYWLIGVLTRFGYIEKNYID